MSVERITNLDEAIDGLARWGTATYSSDPHFSVTNWHPTLSNLEAAANAGYTWPLYAWERATGNRGLSGVHDALRTLGWTFEARREPVPITEPRGIRSNARPESVPRPFVQRPARDA